MLYILSSLAAILGTLGIVLIKKNQVQAWLCSLMAATIIAIIDCVYSHLYADVLLQVCVIITMSFSIILYYYTPRDTKEHRLSSLKWSSHLPYAGLALLLAGALGFVFQRNELALYPYLDSFKTVIGVFAIFLMIYGVIEAWLYWAATYALAVLLFILTDQYIIAFMYIGYLLFSLYTFKLWSDKRVQ